MPQIPASRTDSASSIALIVPDAARRESLKTMLAKSQITVAKEFQQYLSPIDLPEIRRLDCPVVIVDLDADLEKGLQTVDDICRNNIAITVMAYSSTNDATLMRRAMQAGAREFLIAPLLDETFAAAWNRARERLPAEQNRTGAALVFLQSKGGVGVSTLAVNFALELTKISGAKVVVVDLDFQLGEVAPLLGMTATLSVVDALMNSGRLDKEFLSTLLMKHSSGLSVLAAPDQYGFAHDSPEGAGKLFQILKEEFAYVVVDSGSCDSHILETVFEAADIFYLVTEMTFPALRNAHRLISFLSTTGKSRGMQIVVNRFDSRHEDIDETSAKKALGRPINWRVPNFYSAARAAQDTGVPLAMEDSPITRALVLMARAACGKGVPIEKKSRWGFNFLGSRAKPAQADR